MLFETFLFLNLDIFRSLICIGKTFMIKPEVKVRVPRLHYVHPTCFEAGKSMEFIVCGSNLLQAKFRYAPLL